MERRLHGQTKGPKWLADARIAKLVQTALFFGEDTLDLYTLHAWVILPNHVHALLEPKAQVPRITKTVKGYTAREANKLLERTGNPFWQDETFDHWVRDEWSYRRIVSYIERNPVKAGLVSQTPGVALVERAHRHGCRWHLTQTRMSVPQPIRPSGRTAPKRLSRSPGFLTRRRTSSNSYMVPSGDLPRRVFASPSDTRRTGVAVPLAGMLVAVRGVLYPLAAFA